MLALKRIPWRFRRAKAQEWARLSHESRRANMASRGDDAETTRARALDDARGMVLRHGMTYSAAAPDGVAWTILRSKQGRVNQVDLHIGPALVATCSLRTLTRAMKRARL